MQDNSWDLHPAKKTEFRYTMHVRLAEATITLASADITPRECDHFYNLSICCYLLPVTCCLLSIGYFVNRYLYVFWIGIAGPMTVGSPSLGEVLSGSVWFVISSVILFVGSFVEFPQAVAIKSPLCVAHFVVHLQTSCFQ